MSPAQAAALLWAACGPWALAEPSGEAGGPAVSTAPAPFAAADRLYLERREPGKLEESIALLEERLRAEGSDTAALWRLGRSLVRRGERRESAPERLSDFARAKEFIEKSLALREDDAEAHFWWGVAAGRWGQERGLLRSLFLVGPIKSRMRRVLELDPGHGGAHHVLGELYRQLPGFAGGSRRKAVAEFETAARLSPRHTVNHTALGRALLEAGEKEKAARALREALAVEDPDDPAEHEESRREARRLLETLGD